MLGTAGGPNGHMELLWGVLNRKGTGNMLIGAFGILAAFTANRTNAPNARILHMRSPFVCLVLLEDRMGIWNFSGEH